MSTQTVSYRCVSRLTVFKKVFDTAQCCFVADKNSGTFAQAMAGVGSVGVVERPVVVFPITTFPHPCINNLNLPIICQKIAKD